MCNCFLSLIRDGLKRISAKWMMLATMCLSGLCASCVSEALHRVEDDGTLVTAGQMLPDFTVGVHGADTLHTVSLSGKPSVLVFFNTSCSDCRNELPVVNKLYEEYADRVTFLCISRAEEEESVSAFWQSHHLSLPFSAQKDRRVYALFALHSIPRIYVSDASLRVSSVIAEKVGEKALRGSIEAVLHSSGGEDGARVR